MTDNINVQIIEPPLNNLIIETQVGSEPINVSVVSYSGTNISIIHDLPVLPGDINDNIASLLVPGSGINIVYNNNIPAVTISASGLNSEQVQDIVGNLISGSSYVSVDYNDNLNSLTIGVTGLQPSGNYSIVGHSHIIGDVSGLQVALDNKQPSGIYASGVHSHISNDITDFNNSVDSRIVLANLQPSGNYSLIGHNHNINDISGLQIALDSKQPSGVYASGVHTHTINDITNFNSGVSGLLPHISGSQYISTNFNNNIYTISATGLQPSGNYSIIGHAHTSSEITDFNNSVNGLVSGVYAPLISPNFSGIPTVPTATSGTNTNQIASTSFVRNEISNLVNSAPSTLDTLNELATALGNDSNFATTVASGLANKAPLVHSHIIADVSGLQTVLDNKQPSGVYASGIHIHNSNDITDFSSSVSGLLPVKNISAGSGIGISSVSGDFTVSVTGSFGLTSEEVDDRVNSLLFAGTGISLDYNDNSNVLTINTSGLQPSGNYANSSHTHSYTDISNFASGVSNSLTTTLLAGSFIELVYNSGLDTLTIGTSGLQPSGNYSVVGHTHTSSDITNFNSSVSGLLPAISGSGYVSSVFANNIHTVIVTGLQPSGNYSVVGHSHLSSNITDFATSVSGLLPVKDIVAGSGISVGSVSGIYTITADGVAAASASSLVTNCSNRTGSVIPKMTVVYINGGHGNLPTITPAQANNEANSSKTYGITQTQISDNGTGNVVVFGALIDVDTNQFGASEGSTLYLSPTVAGGITATKPSAPDHMVSVGKIIRNHNNQGIIEVVIQNGFELQELHNVAISGVNNGEFLQYNSASGLWVPSSSGNFSSLSVNGTGVSLTGHSHNSSDITNFNSSVSGLLPVTNIVGGSNVSVSASGSIYTVAVTGSLGLTTEEVDDRVSNLLVAGSGINLNYNDNANTLTISTINNIILSDVVDSTNYIGRAVAGTSTSSSSWRIKRTIYNSAGSVTSSTVANNVAWNDRLTASYS